MKQFFFSIVKCLRNAFCFKFCSAEGIEYSENLILRNAKINSRKIKYVYHNHPFSDSTS
jgi:hypothetical protein